MSFTPLAIKSDKVCEIGLFFASCIAFFVVLIISHIPFSLFINCFSYRLQVMAEVGNKETKDLVASSQLKSTKETKKKIRFYFIDDRHLQFTSDGIVKAKVAKWRMKDRVCMVGVSNLVV